MVSHKDEFSLIDCVKKEKIMSQEHSIPMTTLDEMVCDGSLQMLKASLPYLSGNGQRILSVCTKFLEFKHTMDLFSHPGADLSACEIPPASSLDPMSMLNDIRRFCGPRTQENIDQMINLLVMVQMLEVFHADPEGEP